MHHEAVALSGAMTAASATSALEPTLSVRPLPSPPKHDGRARPRGGRAPRFRPDEALEPRWRPADLRAVARAEARFFADLVRAGRMEHWQPEETIEVTPEQRAQLLAFAAVYPDHAPMVRSAITLRDLALSFFREALVARNGQKPGDVELPLC